MSRKTFVKEMKKQLNKEGVKQILIWTNKQCHIKPIKNIYSYVDKIYNELKKETIREIYAM